MSKLRVQSFGDLDRRVRCRTATRISRTRSGSADPTLMEWFFHTRVWRQMHGQGDGETGVDNEMAAQGFAGVGAWILGRNMFGPVRGPWPDDSWKGWWGDEPPYHTPVFVLTHHARAPLTMAGGTEFRFVTGGIHAALEQARAAAGGQRRPRGRRRGHDSAVPPRRPDRRAATWPFARSCSGRGSISWAASICASLGYECVKHVPGERATHVFLRRRSRFVGRVFGPGPQGPDRSAEPDRAARTRRLPPERDPAFSRSSCC